MDQKVTVSKLRSLVGGNSENHFKLNALFSGKLKTPTCRPTDLTEDTNCVWWERVDWSKGFTRYIGAIESRGNPLRGQRLPVVLVEGKSHPFLLKVAFSACLVHVCHYFLFLFSFFFLFFLAAVIISWNLPSAYCNSKASQRWV